MGRIIVWGFFGPHMKLVDLFLRANEKKDGSLNDLIKNFDIQSYNARLRREEALKVKDMKEVAFGKYSVQVPSFNLCKFRSHSLIVCVLSLIFSHGKFPFLSYAQHVTTIDLCLIHPREYVGKSQRIFVLVEKVADYL